jgi:hypothetical protein
MFTYAILPHATTQKYMQKAYRRTTTLNTRFTLQILYSAITKGELLNEIYYAIIFFHQPVYNNIKELIPGKVDGLFMNSNQAPPEKIPYL